MPSHRQSINCQSCTCSAKVHFSLGFPIHFKEEKNDNLDFFEVAVASSCKFVHVIRVSESIL